MVRLTRIFGVTKRFKNLTYKLYIDQGTPTISTSSKKIELITTEFTARLIKFNSLLKGMITLSFIFNILYIHYVKNYFKKKIFPYGLKLFSFVNCLSMKTYDL